MIKYPEPGKVKTRLAKDVGSRKAAEIYRHVVACIMKRTRPSSVEFERVVLYDPPELLSDFETWLPGERYIAQRGHTIGERMDNAIRDLLEMGAEKTVITGADIPDLKSRIIMQAFSALRDADIVIGPAQDGGYYLIGMKSPHPELFQNIPWSTEKVLEETLCKLRRLGLRLNLIETLSDVDAKEDLHNVPGALLKAGLPPTDLG